LSKDWFRAARSIAEVSLLLTVDGKVRTSRKVFLSKEGKTLTVTVKGVNADGKPANNVTVFEKQ